jgi:3'(2'), 5'-bisphosphate nucleotidase
LLEHVFVLALDAGKKIMTVYEREFRITEKADQSPLTEADQRAHHLIQARLSMLTPKIPILSEESTEAFTGPNAEGQYWLIDPLDGTKEFIKRNGEFTVNIALVSQGRPILGVVHAPVPNSTYLAAAGVGAFEQTGQQRHSISVAHHAANSPWRGVGSLSHGGDSLTAFLSRLGKCELIPMGSSLKFCLVAAGLADLYPRLGPTSLWDTAAAQCVVEQAGGVVIDANGIALSYANPDQILNPHFLVAAVHDSTLSKLLG